MFIISFEEIALRAGFNRDFNDPEKFEIYACDDAAVDLGNAAVSLIPNDNVEVIITGNAPQWALMAISHAMRPWVRSIYYGIIDVKLLVCVFKDEE